MCIFGKTKDTKMAKEIATPEKTAEPTEVGTARTAEDEALFGGIPDLRVDRSVASGGNTTGTGLKVM